MSVFEYETQEDLATHIALVEEGRFRKHIVVEGEGGTGKTETVKKYFPWDDALQERIAERFRHVNRLEEEIEQIGSGNLLLPPGLDADEEIEDREEQIRLLLADIPRPCHYWYTGEIYPKGFFLLMKELGHRFDTIIFNDASFKHGADNLFLNALEKPGGVPRTCRWTNGLQTLRATVTCQIILITNEWHAKDTVKWRAVETRVDMVNYTPSIKALLRYAGSWLDDQIIMERLNQEFLKGHIHGLNLRMIDDAARLRAVGKGPKDGPMGWETMLKRAVSAHSVEHVPSDPEAVIRYVRERGKGTTFSSGELRKNISRFHGAKPDKHDQLPADKLEDALKWLRERFQIRQVRPEKTKGAGRGYADLWQLLSDEERQDYKRMMKEEEAADKAAAAKAAGEFQDQKALPAPAPSRVIEAPPPSRATPDPTESFDKSDAEIAKREAARAAKLAAARTAEIAKGEVARAAKLAAPKASPKKRSLPAEPEDKPEEPKPEEPKPTTLPKRDFLPEQPGTAQQEDSAEDKQAFEALQERLQPPPAKPAKPKAADPDEGDTILGFKAGKPGPEGQTFAVMIRERKDPLIFLLAENEARAESYRRGHFGEKPTWVEPWSGGLPVPPDRSVRKMLVRDLRLRTKKGRRCGKTR